MLVRKAQDATYLDTSLIAPEKTPTFRSPVCSGAPLSPLSTLIAFLAVRNNPWIVRHLFRDNIDFVAAHVSHDLRDAICDRITKTNMA